MRGKKNSISVPSKKRIVSDTARFEKLLKRSVVNERYILRLYTTGTTERSAKAIANIRALCDEHLPNKYDLEVIDIYQQPEAAIEGQIIAAPTLIKEFPLPAQRLVGDLSDKDKVLVRLDLQVNGKTVSKPAWTKV